MFLHTVNNFAGTWEKVAFDIFRFEDGLIAEHWDVVSQISADSANDNGKF